VHLYVEWVHYASGSSSARPFLAGTVPSANVMAVLTAPVAAKLRGQPQAHYSTFSVAALEPPTWATCLILNVMRHT